MAGKRALEYMVSRRVLLGCQQLLFRIRKAVVAAVASLPVSVANMRALDLCYVVRRSVNIHLVLGWRGTLWEHFGAGVHRPWSLRSVWRAYLVQAK